MYFFTSIKPMLNPPCDPKNTFARSCYVDVKRDLSMSFKLSQNSVPTSTIGSLGKNTLPFFGEANFQKWSIGPVPHYNTLQVQLANDALGADLVTKQIVSRTISYVSVGFHACQ